VLKKGTAARIPTGGMLPAGADAVVMFENAQSVDENLVEVLKAVAPGENVISVGEDVRRGDLVLKKGSHIRPQDVAALAGIGMTEVPLYEKPKVSIISTGDEIVPARSPLLPGQVRDVNSYNLSGLIRAHGGVPVKKGIFRDVYEEVRAVVEESLNDSAMVIITGGSSVGVMDMSARVIGSLGSPGVLFHGVTLKPGKPTIGGVVDGVPLFGLPGEKTVKARMTKNVSSSPGREEHVRVALEERNGELWAVPVLGKSGLIRTLVMADGTIVIPSQARGTGEGETVEVILF